MRAASKRVNRTFRIACGFVLLACSVCICPPNHSSAAESPSFDCANARAPRAIGQLLDSVRAIELDSTVADRAAAVHRLLERKGSAIGMADSLIAGIVLNVSDVLLTRNRRHFERVQGLTLATL